MRLREIFPQNRKMTHPYNQEHKVIYSNLPLKLWKGRKFTTEVIPVRSYKKGLVSCGKDIKRFTNHSLKLAKVF